MFFLRMSFELFQISFSGISCSFAFPDFCSNGQILLNKKDALVAPELECGPILADVKNIVVSSGGHKQIWVQGKDHVVSAKAHLGLAKADLGQAKSPVVSANAHLSSANAHWPHLNAIFRCFLYGFLIIRYKKPYKKQ